jgi:hypothetical protein
VAAAVAAAATTTTPRTAAAKRRRRSTWCAVSDRSPRPVPGLPPLGCPLRIRRVPSSPHPPPPPRAQASANICAAGAAHVAALLSDPACRLRELSLADNPRVGDAGATATIRAIASTPRSTLARLNLSGCGVTDVTARALADALTGGEGGEGEGGIGTTRCCASLRCVNLRSNGITTAGCDALTRAATATSARDDGRASSLIEVRSPHAGPHATAFARCTHFLEYFTSRRISPPRVPRFASPPSTPFNSDW